MALEFTLDNTAVCQVNLFQEYQGSVLINTLHYVAATQAQIADGPLEVTNLLQSIQGAAPSVRAALLAAQVQTLQHTHATGQLVYPSPRKPYIVAVNVAQGADLGEAMPSNVAAVLTKRGSIAGRGRAGSLHIGGVPRDAVNAASLTLPYRTTLQTLAVELGNAVLGVDPGLTWFPIVAPSNQVLAVHNELIDVLVQPNVRVMRRRTLHYGI
jgi:hypothetical protein